MDKLSDVAKAIAGAGGAVVTYFIGVIPAEGGFDDLSTVQWLAAIPVALGVFGITWSMPDSMSSLRRQRKEAGPPV